MIPPGDFPALWQVEEPPLGLWFEGTPNGLELLKKLPSRGLAIVGTRDPCAQSSRDLERWMSSMRGSDLVILSGFARGIDQKAHETAIVAGLPTIAVLGAGLDQDYPLGSRYLREKIIESGGLIISEFPQGTPAYAGNFLKRNRLIAGWAKAVWIVEAGARSGTLNTANWAIRQHVDCYATPSYPRQPRYSGNQKLLEDGVTQCFWNPKSLGSTWGEFKSWQDPASRPSGGDPRAQEFQKALRGKILSQGSASIEQMVAWASEQGWSAAEVFKILKICLDAGWVCDRGGVLSLG